MERNDIIPLYKVFMSNTKKVHDTLKSGWIGEGEQVKLFEAKLQKWLGTKRLLATNSCTSALHLALHLIGEPGGEVITSPISCFATASAILHNNMKPVWADLRSDTGNISVDSVQSLLNENTKAIMPVHFCGQPAELNRLYSIIRRHFNITGKVVHVVEDCAHAFGSKFYDRRVGSHHFDLELPHEASIKCFSFQAVKALTCGDGGAIVLPTEKLYRRAKKLRWYGLDRDSGKDRYDQNIKEAGFKFQMNDIAASIGLANLPSMDHNLMDQRAVRKYYQDNLRGLKSVKLMTELDKCESSCSLFPVRLQDKLHRDSFIRHMKENGVEADIPHGRIDNHLCVQEYKGEPLLGAGIVEYVACIPAGWWVSGEDSRYVVEQVKEWNTRINSQI